jgi:predicted acylesterase/phospholipase RssA
MKGERKKYERCLVLAGGGGRLGTHLGVHAAACEAGLAPDLVLGTCGGALVAALIHAESDPARRLAFLAGPEMYRFWRSVRLLPGRGLAHAARRASPTWIATRCSRSPAAGPGCTGVPMAAASTRSCWAPA